MSVTSGTLEQLHDLADEVHDSFSEQGHVVSEALELHEAFRDNGGPQAMLMRSLLARFVIAGSSVAGLMTRPVQGGLEVVVLDTERRIEQRFRLRSASKRPEGDYDIIASSDSLDLQDEPDSIYRLESWVLGFTRDARGMLEDLFAARVVKLTQTGGPNGPWRVELGTPLVLGRGLGTTPPEGRFTTSDEDDDSTLDLGEEPALLETEAAPGA